MTSEATPAAWFEAALPLASEVRDICLGGIGLTLTGSPEPELLVQRIVQLDLTLPEIPAAEAAQPWGPLRLALLGVIRHVNVLRRASTVHIQFLQRLPEILNAYFATGERRGEADRALITAYVPPRPCG